MESRDRHARNRSLGRSAEQLAERWLIGRGLSAVARNFHCRHGELDLIMLDDGVLVFVEVRCRRGRSLTRAALTVNRSKQQRLAATALWFIARHPEFEGHPTRFDIVGFDRAPGREPPDAWIRNAFHPDSTTFGR
jgi:putative endonuclease